MKHEEVLNSLCGLPCVDFMLASGGWLFLYFGQIVKEKPIHTESELMVTAAWRIEKDCSVLAGSLSEPELACNVLSTLIGMCVLSVSWSPESVPLDLSIAFSGGLRLVTFSHSVEDEVWEFKSSTGLRVGVGNNHVAYCRQYTSEELLDIEREVIRLGLPKPR